MWIEEFVEYLRCERNRSESTIVSYRRSLEGFWSFAKALDEQITWETLDADVVRQWMAGKMESGMKPSSVCAELSSIRSFYRFLLRRGHVKRDPVRAVSGPKRPKPLPQFVRETEMNRLLDGNYFPNTLDGMQERLVVLTFYSTGLRLAELVSLNWAAIDFGSLTLRVIGKRDKERVIPFGPELSTELSAYRQRLAEEGLPAEDDAPVFVNTKKRTRISRDKVSGIVRKYLSLVTTLKKRSPHVLRHTFATTMLNNEADLQSVKELLGHERITTTEIYTHTTFEELKKSYNRAHPRA